VRSNASFPTSAYLNCQYCLSSMQYLCLPAMKDLDGFSDGVCGKIVEHFRHSGTTPFPEEKQSKKTKGRIQITTGLEWTSIGCSI
jgi:hypothetical protein